MHLTNHSRYQAKCATGILPEGYCVVIAIKATYNITDLNDYPHLLLAKTQQPLYDTDAYSGEPGLSSPLFENDLAPYKPLCDVILPNPIAYAPGGQWVSEVPVAVQIGDWRKSFNVVGRRFWRRDLLFSYVSEPERFTQQPLSWEIAYGGIDNKAYPENDQIDAYSYNLAGIGYWRKPKRKYIQDTPLAQTEIIGQPINDAGTRYAPQCFGPIARNWKPRSDYGGTYDDDWIKNTKPFLPADFDVRYYQSTLEDQQIDYPQGDEIVCLTNLTPEGELRFVLPKLQVPVRLEPSHGSVVNLQPVVDTITIDSEARLLTLVARARHPFIHSIHEIDQIQVGHKPVVVTFDALTREAESDD